LLFHTILNQHMVHKQDLAYAPYADLIWCETATPNLEEAKKFALKRSFLFEIILPAKRKILKKSYSQNFIKKKDV